ncbi:MAG: hypothetical protein ACJ78Q_08100 [Chloroflexia bacterium]
MIVPTDLLPRTLGLHWGMSPTQCLEVLSLTPTINHWSYIRVPMHVAGEPHDVELRFENQEERENFQWRDKHGYEHDWSQGTMWDRDGSMVIEPVDLQRSGLFRIETALYKSQALFDLYNPLRAEAKRAAEELKQLFAEYRRKYEESVAQYIKLLGQPTYSSPQDSLASYSPSAQLTPREMLARNPAFPHEQWQSPLTYWTHPEGRLQVAYSHEDKEEPIIVYLSCYRSTGLTTI